MSRRQPSKIELPSDVPTNAAYGNRSPLSPHSTLNVPLMMRERNVEAAMMKPPTNGLYSSAAASTSNLSLASRADTLDGHTAPGSVTSKYMLTPDPSKWGTNVHLNVPEPDDHLHNPDPRRDRLNDAGGSIFNPRGLANLGCLLILALMLTGLFAVYPITDGFLRRTNTLGGYNLGGINASGQVPEITGNFALIDRDTPESAYTHMSLEDGSEWDLVFSDEFNTDGRSFYPGDDPYWEAVDLHYWGTNNLEWYSPDQVTTKGGFLHVTLENTRWRGLDYKGGMIASWNKFCFTGGYFVDGTFVGRAAPEIDVFEAIISNQVGYISQSGQWAPFNYQYAWKNTSDNLHILSEDTEFNTYVGGVLQQCSSGLSKTNQACYEEDGGCFAVYGFEYKPGNDGYILWTNDNKPAWKLYGAGMGPDDNVKIGHRPVPQEPMYMIINLGMSPQFGALDFERLVFPTTMLVDWVRVYQPKDNHNIGCDPEDFPTRDYINNYLEAYTNPKVVPANKMSTHKKTMSGLRLYPNPLELCFETLPVPDITHPDDAIVKVTLAGLCGSDLHAYRGLETFDIPYITGHELVGIVVSLGESFQKVAAGRPDLYSTLKIGDKVVSPFTSSCGECRPCRIGFTARCDDSLLFGSPRLPGAQAQYIRIPRAGGTLFRIPQDESTLGTEPAARIRTSDASLILLADILPTGYFAALQAIQHPNLAYAFAHKSFPVIPGFVSAFITGGESVKVEVDDAKLAFAVVGLGPVGLCALVSLVELLGLTRTPNFAIVAVDPNEARRAKAEAILATLGSSPGGVIRVVSLEDAPRVSKELSGGLGCDAILEVVGNNSALQLAYELIRPFGVISSVGETSVDRPPIDDHPPRDTMRYYQQKYPEVEDLVMVQVRQIAEMGAYVKLLEYDNIEGMILLSELSRRRIRSIQKLIRVGRNEVVVVLRVDKEKGYIDLSKRRVSPEDITKCEEKFMKSKAVASIMRHVATRTTGAVDEAPKEAEAAPKGEAKEEEEEEEHDVGIPGGSDDEKLEELYEQIVWPLAAKYGHTYDAFKLALTSPEVFEGLNISPIVLNSLTSTIARRLTPQPIKLRADIELTCFQPTGIDAIKRALTAGEAVSTEAVPVKAKLVAPPFYVLGTNATDKVAGVEVLEKAIEAIKAAIHEDGGELNVKMKPKAVSESEDQELAAIMAKANQENQEISGDSAEDSALED
ncbi:Eukaryotic translation initiation factor 2 subunit alpha Short=eIF-2-alpha [Rhizoctonia solani AG-1 IB]|uniref:Eukaryotic translation initiation factor 2 subunit alpha Short=eIF-2-alpha n=2 Tax=Thanatephorus cucumeris (strain AG1-IB / isolate 7/3/14) TaxID=1108050 RepID=M5BKY3_THACB|nr:Eukaryotic translation initiation factor 2 subunit alpha Short=eIF-2-alpha [Rhizoctonia solani AG-1 IB]